MRNVSVTSYELSHDDYLLFAVSPDDFQVQEHEEVRAMNAAIKIAQLSEFK